MRKDAEVSGMIYARPCAKIDDVQEIQLKPERLEKENNNMYKIIGIIDGPLFSCFEALLVFYHCLLTTLSDYRSSRPMHCTLVEKYQ